MIGSEQMRVIVYREGEMYVAQCLEHDIAAQGGDLHVVLDRLDLAIEAEVAMREDSGLDGIPPAPCYYQQLWTNREFDIKRTNVPVGGGAPAYEVAMAKAA